MEIISQQISLDFLKTMAHSMFGNLVKAVIDVEKGIMVLNGELHADEEAMLLAHGSKQSDLWGINLYPEIDDDSWIEFDSMINLRPSQGNRTRRVDDEKIREKIKKIVNKLIKK